MISHSWSPPWLIIAFKAAGALQRSAPLAALSQPGRPMGAEDTSHLFKPQPLFEQAGEVVDNKQAHEMIGIRQGIDRSPFHRNRTLKPGRGNALPRPLNAVLLRAQAMYEKPASVRQGNGKTSVLNSQVHA